MSFKNNAVAQLNIFFSMLDNCNLQNYNVGLTLWQGRGLKFVIALVYILMIKK